MTRKEAAKRLKISDRGLYPLMKIVWGSLTVEQRKLEWEKGWEETGGKVRYKVSERDFEKDYAPRMFQISRDFLLKLEEIYERQQEYRHLRKGILRKVEKVCEILRERGEITFQEAKKITGIPSTADGDRLGRLIEHQGLLIWEDEPMRDPSKRKFRLLKDLRASERKEEFLKLEQATEVEEPKSPFLLNPDRCL